VIGCVTNIKAYIMPVEVINKIDPKVIPRINFNLASKS
jgi:hypothetical protein